MTPGPDSRLAALAEGAWPISTWRDAHVVIAVSGGADSVALLRVALGLKREHGGRGTLYAAHFNHARRGAAADEDEAWLEKLCRELGVSLHSQRAGPGDFATGQGDGWEANAREARYHFLCRTAEQVGARFVATAHTADDQVETVLHHIIRGTGFAGLAGMPLARALSPSVALVRPLLGARRIDVLDYLAALGQDYRIDETNSDRRMTRNRLRHEVLPMLRSQFNPEVDAALLRLAAQAGDVQQWLSEMADCLANKCVTIQASPTRIGLDRSLLAGQPPLLVREVCKTAWERASWPKQAVGFDIWRQLAEFAAAGKDGTSLNLPGGIRAVRRGNLITIARADDFS